MVFFNYTTMQMTAKIVYYGPGLCGKTTNLHAIHQKTAPQSRGEMVSLETETDRTLFFDLLPLDVGIIGGMKVRLQLYTVPGQVFYNATRKLVLKGVDGVVFVADSQAAALDANIEALYNLKENLAELQLTLDDIPFVIQYNKRDIRNILPVEKLNEALNPEGKYPAFEAAALHGIGVFETLKAITKHAINSVRKKIAAVAPPPAKKGAAAQAAPTAAAPPAASAAPAAAVPSPAAPPPAAAPSPAPAAKGKAAPAAAPAPASTAPSPAKPAAAPAGKGKAAAPAPAPPAASPPTAVQPAPPPPAPEPAPAAPPAEEVSVEFAEVGKDRKVQAVKTKGLMDISNELEKLRAVASGRSTPVATTPKALDKRLADMLTPDTTRLELKRKATVEVAGKLLRTAPTVRVHLVFDSEGQENIIHDAVTVTLGANKKLERLSLVLDLEVKGKA